MQVFDVYIHTSPERLWDAFVKPELTLQYFDFIVGFMAVESEWERGSPLTYRTSDGTRQIEGEVLIAEPPERLKTTFSLLYDEGARQEQSSCLTWEIEPVGEVCKLTVGSDAADGSRTSEDQNICLPSILSNLTILLETGRPRLIKEIVVDCASPAILGIFWSRALGYIMQGPPPEPADNFIAIADPQGVGPELGFQRVPEAKCAKNRLHFDLHVVDRASEVERLVSLGGRVQQTYDSWSVMQDPEGNEFCVMG